MTKRFHLLALCAFLLNEVPVLAAPEIPRTDRSRPNIVYIMVDDMGWSNIGPYGGMVETPTLDRLARNGVPSAWFSA